MEINKTAEEMHAIALSKGWYDPAKSIGESIALMHSELSEALEELRGGDLPDYVYYKNDKPEGFGVELADCVIRIMDTCAYYKIDLERMIRIKSDYNKTRPVRHGGKVL